MPMHALYKGDATNVVFMQCLPNNQRTYAKSGFQGFFCSVLCKVIPSRDSKPLHFTGVTHSKIGNP